MKQVITKEGSIAAASNVLLAAMYLLFIAAHLKVYIQTPRLSLIVIMLFETLCLIFVLIRRDPNATWHSWKTWITALGGTFAPLLLRPTDVPADLLFGQVVQISGFLFQIGALLSLNRSFGLLPAHRGVKSDGLYRWVRHPLYTAYTFGFLGYVINNFDFYNVAVLLFATFLQVLRILNEETFLLRYEEYAAYAARTKWRLVPLIW